MEKNHTGGIEMNPDNDVKTCKIDDFARPFESEREIRQAFEAYMAARHARRLTGMEYSLQLMTLAKSAEPNEIRKHLAKVVSDLDQMDQKAAKQWIKTYRDFQHMVRSQYFVANPLHHAPASVGQQLGAPQIHPFQDCETDMAPFDYPIFCPFWGYRSADWGEPLFTEILAPTVGELPPSALNLSQIYIRAEGRNDTASISAAWCFKHPTQEELCGFNLVGQMSLTGLLENKVGSSVRVQMDAGITQYRLDKPWDQINPSVDIPYRNIRMPCVDPANDVLYTEGFIDSTYGLHTITPLQARIDLNFAFDGRTGCYDVAEGDTFFVGYWCEIDVGEQSTVDFSYNGLGTLIMEKPTFVLFKSP